MTEEIKKLDYTGVPEGYNRVGFVIPSTNCCVEKVVGEMQAGLKENGIFPIVVEEENPRGLADYFPDNIIYFRCGTKPGTPIHILGGVEGHIGYFKSLDIPIYYYLDDAFFHANNFAPLKLLVNCDELIFATEALIQYVRERGISKTIHLLKTHIDMPVFDILPEANLVMDKKKLNILYTSEGRIGILMLNRICEIMSQRAEKYKDVRIVCITDNIGQVRSVINRWRGIEKIYYERVPLYEYYGISKMSQIFLTPGEPGDLDYFLPKDLQELWLAAKSCVKYTIAGAASAVCITSKYLKEYEMAISHKETGFIAGDDPEEWMEYIDLMIENQELREKIGKNARQDVYDKWHIYKRVDEFSNILKGNSTCKIA